MPVVRLIHWNAPEARECQRRLASLGYEVEFNEGRPEDGGLSRFLRGSTASAFVIDLSRLPSHGQQVAMWLRSRKDTRHLPIVFVDGDPVKVAKIKQLLPDATYTSWTRLKTVLPKSIATPVMNPVVPPSSIYSGKPAVEKLGVKAGMRVCLINAPKGFADTLTPLPEGVRFSARMSADTDLVVVFVHGRRELAAHLATLDRDIKRQTVWFAWPKKTSGIKSDVDGNSVRHAGLAAGWVDFKVCAIDDTWSGLAFKRRK